LIAALTGLIATLLAVAIVITGTIGTLAARLQSGTKALGAETALIVVLAFGRVSTLRVNPRTLCASLAAVIP